MHACVYLSICVFICELVQSLITKLRVKTVITDVTLNAVPHPPHLWVILRRKSSLWVFSQVSQTVSQSHLPGGKTANSPFPFHGLFNFLAMTFISHIFFLSFFFTSLIIPLILSHPLLWLRWFPFTSHYPSVPPSPDKQRGDLLGPTLPPLLPVSQSLLLQTKGKRYNGD